MKLCLWSKLHSGTGSIASWLHCGGCENLRLNLDGRVAA